jgi:hypothetical protein
MTTEADGIKAFIELMLKHTVRLIRNAHTFPKDSGVASGIILQRDEGLLLLTAGHIFDRPGSWTLDTGLIVGKTTLHAPIRDVELLASVDLATGAGGPVDLAWGWIDPADIHNELVRNPSLKGAKVELPVYRRSLGATPDQEHSYGYASWNRAEFHAGMGWLVTEPSFEVGMEFRGARPDSGVYEFELVRSHQGHSYYEGASGAPIADETGQIVSLLLAGEPNQNLLLGVPLAEYASVLGLGRFPTPQAEQ